MAGRPRLARMAWRNLWRQPRRTGLTLSSIALGTLLAILFTAMQDANFADMIDLAARLGGGHVTLQHPEYFDSPTLSRSVNDSSLVDRAVRDPEVTRVVSRITGQLMLSTRGQSYGAAFLAYDPRSEDATTLSLLEAVREGELLGSSGERGIILGQRLAENLDARLGRKVVYTLTDKHGEIVRDVGRVSGILKTGAPTVDAALCLLPIDRMRAVLGYDADEAVQVAVFLRDQRSADAVAQRLRPDLSAGATALAWHELQPELAGFIAMKVASARFMEVVILLLVAAGIFNTLFVSVMERLRELGIMLALGFSGPSLFRVVMYESLWLGLVGLAVGLLVTAGPYWYLSRAGIDIAALGVAGSEVAGIAMPDVMRVGIFPENLVAILAAALLATLLSGVYPAWKAARVEPVESIRLV